MGVSVKRLAALVRILELLVKLFVRDRIDVPLRFELEDVIRLLGVRSKVVRLLFVRSDDGETSRSAKISIQYEIILLKTDMIKGNLC